MVLIEVFGTDCAKCGRMLRNVEDAVRELGIDAEIRKIDNLDEILERGVMYMPALVIDGEEKAVGHVPCVEDIKRLLETK